MATVGINACTGAKVDRASEIRRRHSREDVGRCWEETSEPSTGVPNSPSRIEELRSWSRERTTSLDSAQSYESVVGRAAPHKDMRALPAPAAAEVCAGGRDPARPAQHYRALPPSARPFWSSPIVPSTLLERRRHTQTVSGRKVMPELSLELWRLPSHRLGNVVRLVMRDAQKPSTVKEALKQRLSACMAGVRMMIANVLADLSDEGDDSLD